MTDVQSEGAVLALGHIFPQETHPFPRDELLARWATEIAEHQRHVGLAIRS
jgi:hypothetical protein